MKNLLVVLFTIVLVAVFATSCATYAGAGSTVGLTNVRVYTESTLPSNCTAVGYVTTGPVASIFQGIWPIGDFSADYRALAASVAVGNANSIVPLTTGTSTPDTKYEAYNCP